MRPRFFVRRKLTAFVNKYKIAAAQPDGASGELIGLAQQKRFSWKEKVMFYSDEKRDKLAFAFRAEKVMDMRGRFLIEDANGKLLGMFKKELLPSLTVSTWKILDVSGGERYIVRESNRFLAVVRRILGGIPLIGEGMDIVGALLRYRFEFIDATTHQRMGAYRKVAFMRDYYVFEADDSLWTQVDWRVLAAMCVALDALQAR